MNPGCSPAAGARRVHGAHEHSGRCRAAVAAPATLPPNDAGPLPAWPVFPQARALRARSILAGRARIAFT